jgi:ABC-type transport system substrate-binding protein
MLDAPAYMAQTSKGRKGFPGNRTIVQRIDPRPGGAKALIRLYAVCGGPASYVCDPKIDTLWARHEASIDLAERERLSKEIQRILVEEYYLVPSISIRSCTPSPRKCFRKARPCTATGTPTTLPSRGRGRCGR